MRVEWDENKREAVLRRRGVDLARAALVLAGDTLIKEDRRHAYGETRWTATGKYKEEYYTIVYTKRGDTFRVITAWGAGRRERRRHQERYG